MSEIISKIKQFFLTTTSFLNVPINGLEILASFMTVLWRSHHIFLSPIIYNELFFSITILHFMAVQTRILSCFYLKSFLLASSIISMFIAILQSYSLCSNHSFNKIVMGFCYVPSAALCPGKTDDKDRISDKMNSGLGRREIIKYK